MTTLIGLVAIVTNLVAVVFYLFFLDAGRIVRYFVEIFWKVKPANLEDRQPLFRTLTVRPRCTTTW